MVLLVVLKQCRIEAGMMIRGIWCHYKYDSDKSAKSILGLGRTVRAKLDTQMNNMQLVITSHVASLTVTKPRLCI